MSQKNETTALVLALLITAGLVGGGLWWLTNRSGVKLETVGQGQTNQVSAQNVQERISVGDKILVKVNDSPDKQAGVQALASGDFATAIARLQAALRANRNDPEALINLNNARIGSNKHYTIAVSVPIGSDPNGSLEILRGVAQAQDEVNQAGGVNGVPLKVAIANDDNDPAIAKQIASVFVSNSEILGVVGPYASDVSLATAPVYQAGELVAISPISTSVKLSGASRYFFRTVPSDYVAARALSEYMLTKLRRKIAAVFFNSQSSYSQSLKSEFVTALSLGGGQAVAEVDLSDPNFSAAQSVDAAIRQGAEVLVLAANTGSLDKALQVVQVNRQRLSLLGGDDVYTPKTLELGGAAAAGMVISVPWHINGPTSSDFPRRSRTYWGGDVNWRTALSYDAALSLIAAVRQNPSRTGVQQALASPSFSTLGASGPVRFLPSGDRNATVQLVKITPGSRSGTGYDFVPISQ